MNESRRTVDARGLACPEPVILTRKALAESGFEELEVLVDDASCQENVVRFATFANCGVESVQDATGLIRVLIRPGAGDPAALAAQDRPIAAPAPAAVSGAEVPPATVFITAAGIGRGDEQLAALLMRGFLFTLTESEVPPRRIILMNGGVRLAVEGSEALVNLRRLSERGVEILACGTCLEFLQFKNNLAVGRVSNMYEIAGFLLEGRTLSL